MNPEPVLLKGLSDLRGLVLAVSRDTDDGVLSSVYGEQLGVSELFRNLGVSLGSQNLVNLASSIFSQGPVDS